MQQSATKGASTPHQAQHDDHKLSLRQPKAVWAVAFACVIAFMGLGLVDPILTSIAAELHATPSQVELLFTSYMVVTGVMMLITGFVSSRIGAKWTLLIGLVLIVAFSALAGTSSTVGQVVGFRAGWGLGNALFIATALSTIVGVSTGTTASAVVLYEAALGLGISVGPLLGGALGGISWRGPFYGVAILMAIGFLLIAAMLPNLPKPKQKTSISAPIRALKYGGLLTMGITAFFYNYGFFTLLGYTPFVLKMDAHGLGYVFFGWGICMAITSVFLAPKLQKRFNVRRTMSWMLFLFALDLLAMGLVIATHSSTIDLFGLYMSAKTALIILVILAGAFLGINSTLVTTLVMEVAPVERSTASAAYSFLRFIGGAIAPWLAGQLAVWFSPSVSFYVAAVATGLAIYVALMGKRVLDNPVTKKPTVVDAEPQYEAVTEPTVSMGDADSVPSQTGEVAGRGVAFRPEPAHEVLNPPRQSADDEFRQALRMFQAKATSARDDDEYLDDAEYRRTLQLFQRRLNEPEVKTLSEDEEFREALRNMHKRSRSSNDDEFRDDEEFRRFLRSMSRQLEGKR